VANIRLHVVPYIGNIPLQRLTPDDLDGLYDLLLTNGRRNGAGGGLSPKMVRNIHNMLRKALADACRKGTLQRNVATLADPPKPGRDTAMRVWTPDQLRQFLDEIAAHRLATAFVTSPPTPGCVAVRCSASPGETSTSTMPTGSRFARP
jgi:hypothetical protein